MDKETNELIALLHVNYVVNKATFLHVSSVSLISYTMDNV